MQLLAMHALTAGHLSWFAVVLCLWSTTIIDTTNWELANHAAARQVTP